MKKLIGLGVILLAVIFLFTYVNTHASNAFLSFPSSSPSVTPTQVPQNKTLATQVINLTIQKGKLVHGPDVLRVPKDEMVVLQVTADGDDELSLLGYDKHVFLQKGKMVVLSFLSSIAGDFSYELRGAHTILGLIHIGQ